MNPTNQPPSSASLTEEEKRVKLAEAMGFFKGTTIKEGFYRPPVPNYFHDLNAIIAATVDICARLNLRSEFMRQLDIKLAYETHNGIYFIRVNATATQRAEALGKTMKLWI